MKNDFFKQRFNSIQILRGIACIFVIFCHIAYANVGIFAVDTFFIISGFMILYSTNKNDNSFFLTKRLLRIIPLYYLMTFFTYISMYIFPSLFEQVSAQLSFLIKSLFFIPFDIIGNGTIQPLMRIGWTINYEIFFYLIFKVSLKISHKYRAIVASAIICLLVFFIHPISSLPIFLSYYSDPILLDFIWGMIAFYICKWLFQKKNTLTKHNIPFLVCLIYLIAQILFFSITNSSTEINNFNRPINLGIPSTFLFISFFIIGLYNFRNKFFDYLTSLGNMSFSIYLLHYYIVQFIGRKVFDFSTLTFSSAIGTIIAIVLTLVISKISYELIEKRLTRYLTKIIILN